MKGEHIMNEFRDTGRLGLLCRLCGCGRPARFDKTWEHRFKNGNEGVFIGGTRIEDNADGTISVFGTSHTWFDGRKYVWPECGFCTAVEVLLDADEWREGEFFTWSSSVNNTDGAYLAEKFTHARKVGGKIRVSANNYGSSPSINLDSVLSRNSAAIPCPGFYRIATNYFGRDGYLYSKVCVSDGNRRVVYRGLEQRLYYLFQNLWQPIPIDKAGGHGYGWLSLNTVSDGYRLSGGRTSEKFICY